MKNIIQHKELSRNEFFVQYTYLHLQILLGNSSRRTVVLPSTSRVMYLYFYTWSSTNFNLELCESGVRLAKRPLSQAFPTLDILYI